jgi:diguanylate cyclase (GGDEF)-like protein
VSDDEEPAENLFETMETQAPAEFRRLSAQAPKPSLIVLSGDSAGRMVRIEDDLIVGRTKDATLRLHEAGISRKHCQLSIEPSGLLRLTDLGSRNGTYVNGERIDTTVLRDGDKIQIGDTVILKFSYADSLEESFQQRLYQSAVRDPLTGLYNRRYMVDRLESDLSYVARHSGPLGLALIDIDHFKRVNDTYGHLVGDQVLASVAELMAGAIRNEDLLARYGGEEFVIVCRGNTEEQMLLLLNRLRGLVEDSEVSADEPDLRVTLSAGVVEASVAGIRQGQHLLSAADEALYEAKRTGRNRVCVYGDVG